MRDTEDHQEEGPTWRNLAVGAGTVVLAISGYLLGDTLTSIRQEFRDIRAGNEARASLPARVDALERRHDSMEKHIRDLEQNQWRNGDKQ